jgi:hypothetical protein
MSAFNLITFSSITLSSGFLLTRPPRCVDLLFADFPDLLPGDGFMTRISSANASNRSGLTLSVPVLDKNGFVLDIVPPALPVLSFFQSDLNRTSQQDFSSAWFIVSGQF